MTEEQKSKFCDDYCKYRERADKVIKFRKEDTDGEVLAAIREGAEKMLAELCEHCPITVKRKE